MALSKIDTTNMIEDVPQSKLDNNINFRNIIINGGMDIAQRGTSFTGLGNGDTGYTTDRFRFVESGSPTYEFTVSQSTDVPTGQGFSNSLKFDCTTADTAMASGDTLKCEQWIEAQNLQYLAFNSSQAKSLTLSFWVKSNKTGTYVVWFYLDDATRQISKQYTISSADTWEKKILTIPGDTSGSISNDSGRGLLISWGLASGTDFTSGTLPTAWENAVNANRYVGLNVNLADSTSNEWYVTGIQLEAGSQASDFEFLPTDVNLQRCKRYYEKSYPLINAPGADTDDGMVCIRIAGSFSNKPFPARFSVEKRNNSPTITLYSKVGTVNNISNMSSGTTHSSNDAINGVVNIGSTGFAYVTGVTGTNTEGHCLHYTADCEL